MRRKLLLVKKQMNYGSYRDMKEARRKPKPAYEDDEAVRASLKRLLAMDEALT